MLKGTAAVLVAGYLRHRTAPSAAGLGAFLGHLFPVWLGFKGGKGVATYLGVLAGLIWPAALLFAVVWLGVAFLMRYSSLAALTACVVVPIALYFLGRADLRPSVRRHERRSSAYKHRANIARLLAGTESAHRGEGMSRQRADAPRLSDRQRMPGCA